MKEQKTLNDFIQSLEANATNGKENFCYISENTLLALKELSKREEIEDNPYQKIVEEINSICLR